MRQKKTMWIAIACGVASAGCVALFLLNVQGEANAARAETLARYGGEQVEVCVATRDIAAGEKLDLSAVETRLWVADLLPEGAVRASSDAVGKTATSSIIKGEVISEKRFESNRGSIDVPNGKEAVSVPAKAVRAVGGAIRPGMTVDVYAAGDSSTAAIARDVLVLDSSVGESGSLVSSDTGWITLAIDSEKVEEIVAASSKTDLYFVLPGERDAVVDSSTGTSQAETPETSSSAAQAEEGDAKAEVEATSSKSSASADSSGSSSSSSSEPSASGEQGDES